MRKIVKVRSRAITIYIKMESGIDPVINSNHFAFVADDEGRVGEKTVGEWEREYAGTRDSLINQLNRSYGDEQRQICKQSKQTQT